MTRQDNKNATKVKVIVPPNLGPDRRILVQTPDGRRIAAVVPKESSPGSAILVELPPREISKTPSQNLPQQQQQQQQQQPRIQTIKVPKGKRKKGERFTVRLPSGKTITVTVPFDGCKEFSVDTSTQTKQERQQNWHDNPLAVAPMVLGPLMM